MGVVGNGFRHGEETVNLLKGAKRENMSTQFYEDVDWMHQLLQRYGLATVNSKYKTPERLSLSGVLIAN